MHAPGATIANITYIAQKTHLLKSLTTEAVAILLYVLQDRKGR